MSLNGPSRHFAALLNLVAMGHSAPCPDSPLAQPGRIDPTDIQFLLSSGKGPELALSLADPADDTDFCTDLCPDPVRPSRLAVASLE